MGAKLKFFQREEHLSFKNLFYYFSTTIYKLIKELIALTKVQQPPRCSYWLKRKEDYYVGERKRR
jgi:hypothetical protein